MSYQKTVTIETQEGSYRVTIQQWPYENAFGKYNWNVTDLADGTGAGGFADLCPTPEDVLKTYLQDCQNQREMEAAYQAGEIKMIPLEDSGLIELDDESNGHDNFEDWGYGYL
jgi:hypothetical protein